MQEVLNQLHSQASRILIYSKALGKWLLVSGIAGILCGLLGSAFHLGVDLANALRLAHPWLIWLLPVAGLAIAGIYALFSVEGQSTNSIISEVQSGKGLKWSLIPSIFLSTLLTHLVGGSAGREGAALQMGGTIGFEVGKLLHLDDRDLRTATLAGMAAFFSALFGTPLAATIFAMAVISIGLIYHAALIPCLIASITAYEVSLLFHITPMHFTVAAPALGLGMMLRVSLLGALCGFVALLFCDTLHLFERKMEVFFPNPYVRAAVGGAALLGLSLLFPSGDYNGTGAGVIVRAIEEGQAKPLAFLLKILFTSVTLSAGFKGGEIVPTFFIGSTFGCLFGPLLGIPPEFAACVGLVGTFCGAVNCPLASVILSVELFGSESIIYFAIVCFICYMLSGYSGLYSEQKIIYSKLKAEYINIKTD